MNFKLILAQALLAFVSGQAVEDSVETSAVPDLIAQGAAVGLVEPTSPWEQNAAKETSAEGLIAAATGVPLNLLMNGGSEGDLHGAVPRNNMLFFGVGHHGVSFNEHKGEKCDKGHHVQHGSAPCAAPYAAPYEYHQEHHLERPVPQPCGNENRAQPYVKVTPCISVETVTKTHVQTCVQTSLEVVPYYVTRTLTDALRTTKTHIARPEITHTYVEKQTIYEYPAATIKGDAVKCAPQPAYTSQRHYSSDNSCDHGCDQH